MEKVTQAVEQFEVPSPHGMLSVRHQRPTGNTEVRRPPLLYVHGATFPSALSVNWAGGGDSWMDALTFRGHDVWAFDFLGFGESDRFPAMTRGDKAGAPLGGVAEAVVELRQVVQFVRKTQGMPQVQLLAHSWGTLVVGAYAARYADSVERLALFGPIAERVSGGALPILPAYQDVTLEDQWIRFQSEVPEGESMVFPKEAFARWASAYLDTDPTSHSRTPPSVRVPMGPIADIVHAHHGTFPYDPAQVQCPVLIVRGEWDSLSTEADAQWLWRAFVGAPWKMDIKLSRGTHVMHLEAHRHQLHQAVESFLRANNDNKEGNMPI